MKISSQWIAALVSAGLLSMSGLVAGAVEEIGRAHV